MKSLVVFGLFLIVSALFFSSCLEKKVSNTKQKTDITEFLGQWTIDIKGGSVGWLEVRQADRYLANFEHLRLLKV
jgi:ABC-type Fe3+-citrate transport system substrate-binding protein